METFLKRVSLVQNELKAPKGQFNKFGNYKYRSCEDILEAVKPICAKHGMLLKLSDRINPIGSRYYVEATATLYDLESDATLEATASAREEETKKGMDGSQITGASSSYARKYALNGLFNIDDTKDADTNEFRQSSDAKAKQEAPAAGQNRWKCERCGTPFATFTAPNGKVWTPEEQYKAAQVRNRDGVARCSRCRAVVEKQDGSNQNP